MWRVMLFAFDSTEVLDEALQGLSTVANCRAESGFYFFSQRSGEPEFQFDCELISGGLITDGTGNYFSFFGHFVDTLSRRFGALEIGPDGALPSREP